MTEKPCLCDEIEELSVLASSGSAGCEFLAECVRKMNDDGYCFDAEQMDGLHSLLGDAGRKFERISEGLKHVWQRASKAEKG